MKLKLLCTSLIKWVIFIILLCNCYYHMQVIFMNNLNVNVMLLQEKSSSSSSDGLSFIDNALEDEIILLVLKNLFHRWKDPQHMMLLLQLRQVAKALTHSASRPRVKKRRNRRDREYADDRLYRGYFVEDSIYNKHHFRHRFRMRRHLFIRTMVALGNHSEYFQLR